MEPPEEDFRSVFANKVSAALLIVGLVGGIIGTIWGIENFLHKVVYVESLILLGILYHAYLIWDRARQLWTDVEEWIDLDDFFEEKRRTHAVLRKKKNTVEIRENGPDKLTYEFGLSAAFEDRPVNHFYGLFGTDKEMEWTQEDLREMIDVENAVIIDHERRDWHDHSRYLIKFELPHPVTHDEMHEFSYSFEHDVASPASDFGGLIIREETNEASISVTFPENWRPATWRCLTGISEAGLSESDISGENMASTQPDRLKPSETENGRWKLKWNSYDVGINEVYRLTWKGKRLNDQETPSG